MKEFFKYALASFVGGIFAFAFIIFGVILFMLVLTAMFSSEGKVTISPNSVLKIELNYDVPDRSGYYPGSEFGFDFSSFQETLGLNDIIRTIRRAKSDENIKGIYLDLDNIYIGSYSTVEEIRNALKYFKESGKFIFAHGTNVSFRAYYLASAADKIFLAPKGMFDFRGLSIEMTFFKKTLDKLGIEAQIFKSGKYKSAVEIFESDKLSEANRKQLSDLVNSYYNYLLSEISASRGIGFEELHRAADNGFVKNSMDAFNFKLADSLLYFDEFISLMKQYSTEDGSQEIKYISLPKYSKVPVKETYSKNRIAIIYAAGDIIEGKGGSQNIGRENISKEFKRVRENKNIKAVVFRVNSGGGSAFTSDALWRELSLTRKEKPVIVSMGSMAASGGYYISCPADSIVANPTTLTGSIGVFGIIPNTKNFFDDKLGITFDRVKTGRHSDMFTLTRPLTSFEKNLIVEEIDSIYSTFLQRVSAGRNMAMNEVEKIAQGRIWSGIDAKKTGLVDEIGGLIEAVEIAAAKSNIDNYQIVEYPFRKNPFDKLFEIIFSETELYFTKLKLGEAYTYYERIAKILNNSIYQTKLPFDFTVD